jgi:hypothetical protein
MTQNVTTRLDAQICKADIPEEIFRQMRTCQTATNEFLRQFWSAVYPPIGETLGGPTTLTQKTAKATRMAGYLTKTPEKVAAILRAAEMPGVDRTRVQIVECTGWSTPPITDRNGLRACNRFWMQRREHSKREKQRHPRGGQRHRTIFYYNFEACVACNT